jgi:1-acyl-sn-glycerol-3-phosphate acyltransferase
VPWFFWVILALALLLGAALLARWVMDGPAERVDLNLAQRAISLYAKLYHRLTIRGGENIPNSRRPGPLIVVCNHTAGVDPLLVQTACPFEVRWMMATDMRLPRYEWFWRWARIISVDRTGKDAVGAREAIRHVKDGGVLGVFPEGVIERPPHTIMPFHGGVGLIIARTGAPVLPVIIDGTPQVAAAWESLWTPSRSRVEFGPLLRLDGLNAGQVVSKLEQWFTSATGWPMAQVSGPQRPRLGGHGPKVSS